MPFRHGQLEDYEFQHPGFSAFCGKPSASVAHRHDDLELAVNEHAGGGCAVQRVESDLHSGSPCGHVGRDAAQDAGEGSCHRRVYSSCADALGAAMKTAGPSVGTKCLK